MMAGAAARHDARHLQETLGSAFATGAAMPSATPPRGLMALAGARRALSHEEREREAAARALAARLAVALAEEGWPAVEVTFAGRETARLPGAIDGAAMPLACGVIAGPTGDVALILADAVLLDLIVDLACGGAERPAPGRQPARPASGFEAALAGRLFEIVLAQAGAFLPDGAGEARLARIETDPRRIRAAGLPERAPALHLEIARGERRARLTMVFLAGAAADAPARPDAPPGPGLGDALALVPARLDALLAPASLRLSELGRLAPGDVLVLPFGEDEPVRLAVGGFAIGRGPLGRSAGRLGVALEAPGKEARAPSSGPARVIRSAMAGHAGGEA